MMPLVGCVACGGAMWIDAVEGASISCACGRSRVAIESGDLILRGPCVVTWLPDGEGERIPVARRPIQPLL
jgi:hypothetical protein